VDECKPLPPVGCGSTRGVQTSGHAAASSSAAMASEHNASRLAAASAARCPWVRPSIKRSAAIIIDVITYRSAP